MSAIGQSLSNGWKSAKAGVIGAATGTAIMLGGAQVMNYTFDYTSDVVHKNQPVIREWAGKLGSSVAPGLPYGAGAAVVAGTVYLVYNATLGTYEYFKRR